MNINVEIEDRAIRRFVRQIGRQFSFAMARALNEIVLSMQAKQRLHQQRVFKIRRKQYWHQAVKIPPGGFAAPQKKRLEAKMVIDPKGKVPRYDIWQRQEYGGTREPIMGRKSLAIPQPAVKRTGVGLIQAAQRPKRVMEEKARGFEVTFPSGKRGIFQRIGPRSKGYTTYSYSPRAGGTKARWTLKTDPNVRFLYFLAPKAEIDPVYDYFKNAEQVFRGNWPRTFDKHLIEAFRTAKG